MSDNSSGGSSQNTDWGSIFGKVASTGLSMYQSKKEQERMAESSAADRAAWSSMSKPSMAALEATARGERGQLGQARSGAYRNLASNLASRGWGSGSGLGASGAAQIEGSYMRSLAQLANNMVKQANTPMWAPPGSAYTKSTPGMGEAGAAKAGGFMDTALGYQMMMKMLKGQDAGPDYNLDGTYGS